MRDSSGNPFGELFLFPKRLERPDSYREARPFFGTRPKQKTGVTQNLFAFHKKTHFN
ncbi:hypothetical protein FSS13T_20590 [Flavobacterium saliperosum S13]|uniref:Uncharacterized protein n=1 Tax=Flavobacterium saliperosum S13 TaxID=1341155 RepID=A0ABN0QF85_9FLAO|nr:hypothetical protein FSS13T_20590 [Flavobacterium saliperosum S13]